MLRISLLFCSFWLAFGAITATAQIHQYTVMVGGDVAGRYWRGSLPSNVPDAGDVKFTSIEIQANPRGGIFLWQQFAIGLGADYSYATRLIKDHEKLDMKDDKEVEWVLGPFARYYFLNRIFTEGFIGVGLRNIDDGERTDVLRASLGLGYALFVNEKIAVEPILRYVNYSREITQSIREKRNGVQLSVGLQIYLFHDKMVLYK